MARALAARTRGRRPARRGGHRERGPGQPPGSAGGHRARQPPGARAGWRLGRALRVGGQGSTPGTPQLGGAARDALAAAERLESLRRQGVQPAHGAGLSVARADGETAHAFGQHLARLAGLIRAPGGPRRRLRRPRGLGQPLRAGDHRRARGCARWPVASPPSPPTSGAALSRVSVVVMSEFGRRVGGEREPGDGPWARRGDAGPRRRNSGRDALPLARTGRGPARWPRRPARGARLPRRAGPRARATRRRPGAVRYFRGTHRGSRSDRDHRSDRPEPRGRPSGNGERDSPRCESMPLSSQSYELCPRFRR